MKKLEDGVYTVDEINEALEFNFDKRNLKQRLSRKLNTLGYIVKDAGRGKLEIKAPEILNEPKQAKDYSYRETDSYKIRELTGKLLQDDFACHLYEMINNPVYAAAPNTEREDILYKKYGFELGENTCWRWNRDLISKGLFEKYKDFDNKWKTYYENDEIQRAKATQEEWDTFFKNQEEMTENWENCANQLAEVYPSYMPEKIAKELAAIYQKAADEIGNVKEADNDNQKKKKRRGAYAKLGFKSAYSKLGYVTYICPVFQPIDARLDDIQKLNKIVTKIAEARASEIEALKVKEEREEAMQELLNWEYVDSTEIEGPDTYISQATFINWPLTDGAAVKDPFNFKQLFNSTIESELIDWPLTENEPKVKQPIQVATIEEVENDKFRRHFFHESVPIRVAASNGLLFWGISEPDESLAAFGVTL